MNTQFPQEQEPESDSASFNGFGSYRRKRFDAEASGKGTPRSFRRIPRSEFADGGNVGEGRAESGEGEGMAPGEKPFRKKPFGKKPFGKKPFGGFEEDEKHERDEGRELLDTVDSDAVAEEGGHRRFGKKPQWKGPQALRRPYGAPEGEGDGDEDFAGGEEGNFGGDTDFGKPFGKKPFGKKPFGRKPFGKKPFGKKPFGKKPFGKKPFGGRSFKEDAGGEETFGERPFGRKPFAKKPFGKKPFGHKPYSKNPFRDAEDSGGERDFEGKRPFGKGKPFGKKPFGKKPFGKKPFGKKAFGKKQFGRKGDGGKGHEGRSFERG